VFSLGNDKTETINATVVGSDSEWDISALKLDRIPSIALGAQLAKCTPKPGEMAYAAGYSANRLLWLPGKAAKGYKASEWRITNAANTGDSGGATFNAAGEFVATLWGMNSHTSSQATQTVANDNEKTRAVLRRLFGRRICGPGECVPEGGNTIPSNPGRRPEEPDWDVPPLEPPDELSEEDLIAIADQVFAKYSKDLAGTNGTPGQDGRSGQPGQPGPAGTQGPQATVDYELLVDAVMARLMNDDELLSILAPRIQSRLDGIRVNHIGANGETKESAIAQLGGDLNLRFSKVKAK